MAGSMSDTYEKKVLDLIFRNTAASATIPLGLDTASVWIGLFTDAAATSHDSAFGTEVSGGSYGRQAVARSGAPAWNAASGALASTTNSGTITFTTATANWGTVNQFCILDHVTNAAATNIIYWGDLTTPKTISSGDTATFAAGAITITQD